MMAKYVFWKEEKFWVGYFEDYPDYQTQGESLEDLKDHLRDLYKDLVSGEIPGIRKKALLKVA
ncbi:MAG: type II toxin-antitoxin system HicB family antitoxin [Candidatus Riflebacteria bacterium]|nr:type II toxin-antitoxin system HicB family antitoxin [Candidatus Riflebacteria bacterium]